MAAAKRRKPAASPASIAEVFSGRLREVRRKRDWRQQDLADAMARIGSPIDRATIAKIESGKGRARTVTLEEAVALAAALDVALVHLVFPLDDEAVVQVAPKVVRDAATARAWARGIPGGEPLDPANLREYHFQSPLVDVHALAEARRRPHREEAQ